MQRKEQGCGAEGLLVFTSFEISNRNKFRKLLISVKSASWVHGWLLNHFFCTFMYAQNVLCVCVSVCMYIHTVDPCYLKILYLWIHLHLLKCICTPASVLKVLSQSFADTCRAERNLKCTCSSGFLFQPHTTSKCSFCYLVQRILCFCAFCWWSHCLKRPPA